MSDSLWPHEPQHTRPPCPSPTPGVYSNSWPSSQWWHPAISSSVDPFSSCPQSFSESGSFQMSQLFTSDSQSIGVSASASILPTNTQDWSPLAWAGWISLQSKRLSRGIGEFNSDDHYIYYCGQESLTRNRVAIMVNKRVWNAVLGCNLKNDRMISVCFQGKPFNITVIQAYAPTSNSEEAEIEWFYEDLHDLLELGS